MANRRPSKGSTTPSLPSKGSTTPSVPTLKIVISDERQWPSLQQAFNAPSSRRRSRSAKTTVRSRAKSQPPIFRAATDGNLPARMSALTISTDVNDATNSAAPSMSSGPIFTPRVIPEKKPARARVSFGEDMVVATNSPIQEVPVQSMPASSCWSARGSGADENARHAIAPPDDEPEEPANAHAEDTGGTADQQDETSKCTEGDTGSEKTRAVQADQTLAQASKGGGSQAASSARQPSPAKEEGQKAPRHSSVGSRVSDATHAHFVDWLEERPASLRMGILSGMGWEYPLSCSEKRELIMLDLAGETMTQRETIEEKEMTIEQLLHQRRRMQENMATVNGARNSSSSNGPAACTAGGA